MINMGSIMSLSKRDNTKPAFTPIRASLPAEKRPRITSPVERRSMILDAVHPRDFRELNIIYCCEQCSYFNTESKKCAMGFQVEKHKRQNQLDLYYRTGKMAFCRSLEID